MISLRRIKEGDYATLREIRLRALLESPEAFGATHADTLGRTEDVWREQARRSATGSLRNTLLAFDGGSCIGMAALYREEQEDSEGDLLQMWIDPEYRGTGVACELISELLRWAGQIGLTSVGLSVTTTNLRAISFYERCEFRITGEEVAIDVSRGLRGHRMRRPLAGIQTGVELQAVTISVRILKPADAAAYRAIRLQALREQPPAFGSLPEDVPAIEEIAPLLEPTEDRCFLGAFSGEELVGILRVSRYAVANEKHRAYLAGLYVTPAHRRAGCGKALIREALARVRTAGSIRRVNLTVVTRQEAAVRLYQSFGFRIVGTDREVFSAGEECFDEHLMTLEIRPGLAPDHSMITRLDHVQLAMPPGQEDRARAFFGGILGMTEEMKPEPLAARGGCWFRAGEAILHLGVEKDAAGQKKAHPAFCVRNLSETAEKLSEAGCAVSWDEALPSRRRLYTSDPFGNRIELIQDGDGFGQK